MAITGAPNSYKDPFWSKLASAAENKVGLPKGLLVSILTKGERSNANQVSEASAKTPFQIIPSTRNAIIKKYGIDPYLNPQNAAEGAARLLKESLERNNNNPMMAAAEYHGGTDRNNWGPKTKAYVQRVASGGFGGGGSTPDEGKRAAPPTEPPLTPQELSNIHNAYSSGRMDAKSAKEYERDIKAGVISLPEGAQLNAPDRRSSSQPTDSRKLPPGILEAYQSGKMDAISKLELEMDVRKGMWDVPPGIIKERYSDQKTTAAGVLGAVTRGISPVAAGAALGAMGGSVIPVLGTVGGAGLGAAAGALVEPIGDPIVGGINSLFGTNFTKPSEGLAQMLTHFGVAEPKTEAERLIMASTKGATSVAGPIGVGNALMQAEGAVTRGVGQQLASNPVQQMAASAGASGAAQATQDAGGGMGPQLGAGLLGALAGGGIAGAASPKQAALTATMPAKPNLAATARTAGQGGMGADRARQVLAQEATPNPKVLEAAKRLKIDQHLQPDHVTTSQAYRELTQAIKSVPGSKVRAQEIEGLRDVGKRADDLIAEIGGKTDLSNLDSSVKGRIGELADALDQSAEQLYAKLRQEIKPATPTSAENALKFVRNRQDELGGIQNLSAIEKSIVKKLGGKNIPTYALVDDMRKEVGAAARAKGPFKDADTGLAKRLYALLDEDQAAIAKAQGLENVYASAKGAVRMRKGLEDDLASLYGKQLEGSLVGKLDSATKALSQGDAAKMAKIVKALPEDMRQDVMASALNTAFGKSTQNGSLNFNTYTKWYEGLLQNKQAYNTLMTNLPQNARKKLSDLYRVSKSIGESTGERITTGRLGSSPILTELQGPDTLMSNVYGIAKRAAVGIPIEVAATALGSPGAGIASGLTAALTKNRSSALEAADNFIASPEFNFLAKRMATKTDVPKSTFQRVVSSSRFKRFADEAKLPKDPVKRALWLMNSARSPMNTNKEKKE